LEIKDTRLFNIALIGKWIWRLKIDKEGIWKEIIESKYGEWRGLKNQNRICVVHGCG